jgi:hypothetical protein
LVCLPNCRTQEDNDKVIGKTNPILVHASDGRKMAQALKGGGRRVEQVLFNRRDGMADWLAAVEELTPHLGADSGSDAQRNVCSQF